MGLEANDPRRLQRRHSVGSLADMADAAEKGRAIHPARLRTAPKVPSTVPFATEAPVARFYATRSIHATDEALPPLAIDDESVRTFRRSPPGVAFCGVLRVDARLIYLCPLVPLKGSNPYPDKLVDTSFITKNVKATPILHTDIKVRQASGTGEASHDQLAKRVDPGQTGTFVGFTAWKGEAGDAVALSFTSRSQNTSAFGEGPTVKEICAEQERNKLALAAQREDKIRYDKELAEFQEKRATLSPQHAVPIASSSGGPPPPPLMPPKPVGMHGYSVRAANQASLAEIGGKGTNQHGIVSMPYAIAILQCLRAYFRPGQGSWEV